MNWQEYIISDPQSFNRKTHN